MGLLVRAICLTCVVLALAGCSLADGNLLESFKDREEVHYAEKVFALVKSGDIVVLGALTKIDSFSDETLEVLTNINGLFPEEEATAVTLVGFNLQTTFTTSTKKGSSQFTVTSVSFQYQFSEKWILAGLILRDQDGTRSITTITARVLADSLENTNKFELKSQSLGYYAMLFLSVAIPLFIVATFVLCLRTKMRRKWRWAIFILVGFFSLTLNWSTGETVLNFLGILLLGAGFERAGSFSPLMLEISLPLGAILFWIKRWKSRRAPEESFS